MERNLVSKFLDKVSLHFTMVCTSVYTMYMLLYFVSKADLLEEVRIFWCMYSTNFSEVCSGAQRAKFAQMVHKPPLGVNVINFELNGINAFI